jgi:hypothetical protein
MRGAPASERSDLYALGVVLADAAREGVDADFRALVDRMRDPDPEARPASAADALAELEPGSARSPAGEPTRPFPITEREPIAAAEPTRPAFEPTPTGVRSPERRNRMLVIGGLAAVALVALVLALAGGSDDPRGGGVDVTAERGDGPNGGDAGSGTQDEGDDGAAAGAGAGAAATEEPVAEEPPPEEPSGGAQAPAGPATTDPSALNDQGFALVEDGQFEEAVPLLEDAVDGLRDSGDEATYNYALFNLASAYLGSGRPADAIPLLEERMGFDDGQLGTVSAALDRAYAEAGVEPPGDAKPGNGPKDGSVPPPFEDDD